jgi:hypothetical protein
MSNQMNWPHHAQDLIVTSPTNAVYHQIATQGRPESNSPLMVLNPAKVHAAMEIYAAQQALHVSSPSISQRVRGWFSAAKKSIAQRVRPHLVHSDLTNSVTATVNATYRHIALYGATPPSEHGSQIILNPATVGLAQKIHAANQRSHATNPVTAPSPIQQLLQRVKSLVARPVAVPQAVTLPPTDVIRPPAQIMAGDTSVRQNGHPPQMQ